MKHRFGRVTLAAVAVMLTMVPALVWARGTTEPAAEPVTTVTVATYHAASDSQDFSQTAVGQQILDEIGIRVEVVGKPSETEQAVIADLAAGLLPDISLFWVTPENPVFEIMLKAGAEGQLAPLQDAIAEHSPVLQTVLSPDYPAADEVAEHLFRPQFGDDIYIMPAHHSIHQGWISGHGLYIRGDIADQLGIPTPDYSIETTDDFHALLTRIRDEGFVDVNQRAIYPLGGFSWAGPVFGTVGRPFDFGGQAFMGLENGQVVPWVMTDYAWENIRFVRRLIADGLIDPEMFTDSYERMAEKIAQGRFAVWPVFASFAVPTSSQFYIEALVDRAPQMAYRPLGHMLNHMGNRDTYHFRHIRTALGWAVSANADVDAAIRLMDWINAREGRASLRLGVQNEHWFWNDEGYAEMYPEAYEEFMENPDAFRRTHGATTGGSALFLLSKATGFDNRQFDTKGEVALGDQFYWNNPEHVDQIREYRDAVMPNPTSVSQEPLSGIFATYPDWSQFRTVWNERTDVIYRAYLVDSESEARRVLDSYRQTLRRQGLDDFVAFVQSVYDENPDAYSGYIIW